MPTTRRTKGAVLETARDDPMPRRPRSRATSVASSQVSNDDRQTSVVPTAIARLTYHQEEDSILEDRVYTPSPRKQTPKKRTLRGQHLNEQLEEYKAQNQPEEKEDEPIEQQEETPKARQDAPPSATPATQTVALKSSTPEAPATVPRWRQLLSSLGGFSPFPRRSNTPRTEQASKQPTSSDSPLGELPQNRKRSAPAATEQTPTKKAKTPEPEPEQNISKQAELPAQDFAAQTPSRPTRKMSAPRTEQISRTKEDITPRRRTIKDVRSAMVTRTTAPISGLRRWETPSKPKEPNADKRLARMQQLEKLREEKKRMEEEIAKLAAEQEADGIDTRRRKRVKVDELAYIPHNNPGDAIGTFRVPDWDSDDEMEVDDEVPVRQNVFSLNAEKKVEAPAPRPAAVSPAKTIPTPAAPLFAAAPVPPKPFFSQPAPQEKPLPPVQKASEPVKPAPVAAPKAELFKPAPVSKPAALPKFQWPSVGSKTYTDSWSEAEKIAGSQKFARGFESWLAVGLTA